MTEEQGAELIQLLVDLTAAVTYSGSALVGCVLALMLLAWKG